MKPLGEPDDTSLLPTRQEVFRARMSDEKICRAVALAFRGWETEKSIRRRVRNAVCWLNANRARSLGNMVASMAKRVAMCLERKGAMTEY